MSAENVELVRSLHPGSDFDLAPAVSDDDFCASWRALLGSRFDPSVQGTIRIPGSAPTIYSGMDGLRQAWLAWLEHWRSYRDEIEDVIDGGDELVVVIHRSHGQLQPGDTEVTRRSATVWTVRDGRVASVEFNVPYDEALSSVGMVV
jgi:hypothetical protein